MQVVVIDSKTKEINEKLTHKYWRAMNNDSPIDLPYGLKLAIRKREKSVREYSRN